MCEIDIGNLKTRNSWKTLRLLSSGTKLFITFKLLGFSTWVEGGTILLCWLLLHRQLSTQPTRGAPGAQIRLASAGPESQPSSSQARTQLTDFSQIPKILSLRFRCMTSFTSPGPFSIWNFYFEISEWHILSTRAWTPALMLHLTNPCAERRFSA